MAISERVSASRRLHTSAGFTLVELIVGIVLSGIALTLVATLIFPLFTRSVEPLFQVRAAELAQAILEDALAKNYDESTPVGGQLPCSTCTQTADLGMDGSESSRADINDVDDYNAFCGDQAVEDISGTVISGVGDDYAGYQFSVCVTLPGNAEVAKLITVTVTPPSATNASPVTVSAYRYNY